MILKNLQGLGHRLVIDPEISRKLMNPRDLTDKNLSLNRVAEELGHLDRS
ncbi:hypothetical protein OAF41_00675 [bacterium]|nr:hypothetical protein [bacterium]